MAGQHSLPHELSTFRPLLRWAHGYFLVGSSLPLRSVPAIISEVKVMAAPIDVSPASAEHGGSLCEVNQRHERRIPEFEALRGVLALWVLVGHVVKHSGYAPEDLGLFGLVAAPGAAVDVFIILSGFVIFSLLDGRDLTYSAFAIQRFFRLFPLFAVVLLASAPLISAQEAWLDTFPWQTPFIRGCAEIARASREYLAPHVAAHLTMLHGLIPDSVMLHSQYAIVGQAWSISVEWQFYLVAPLLYWACTRWPVATAAIVLAISIMRGRYWLGEGFAINQALFFLIGILTYFLIKRLNRGPGVSVQALLTVSLVGASVIYLAVPHPVSLLIWIGVVSTVISCRYSPMALPLKLATFARTPAAQWLGKISYSIYLTHFLVLFCASFLLLQLFPTMPQAGMCLMLLLATLVGTLALSSLTFMSVEAPAMALGHRLAKRIQGRYGDVVGNRRIERGNASA